MTTTLLNIDWAGIAYAAAVTAVIIGAVGAVIIAYIDIKEQGGDR